MTRTERAFDTLDELPDAEAIEAIRMWAEKNVSGTYAFDKIDAGLDECLAEIREDERLPRFVSSDFAYIEYPKQGGVRL